MWLGFIPAKHSVLWIIFGRFQVVDRNTDNCTRGLGGHHGTTHSAPLSLAGAGEVTRCSQGNVFWFDFCLVLPHKDSFTALVASLLFFLFQSPSQEDKVEIIRRTHYS